MTDSTPETKPARSLKENLQETLEILKSGESVTLPRKLVIAAVVIALGLIIF